MDEPETDEPFPGLGAQDLPALPRFPPPQAAPDAASQEPAPAPAEPPVEEENPGRLIAQLHRQLAESRAQAAAAEQRLKQREDYDRALQQQLVVRERRIASLEGTAGAQRPSAEPGRDVQELRRAVEGLREGLSADMAAALGKLEASLAADLARLAGARAGSAAAEASPGSPRLEDLRQEFMSRLGALKDQLRELNQTCQQLSVRLAVLESRDRPAGGSFEFSGPPSA